jgi:TPP-dependent pyruvate/acetoin dehydrogenase alpha subunit
MLTKQELIDFETDIGELYKKAEIRGPIHLRDGNEEQLINIFKNISWDDYVFSTWANHLHALLKGISAEKVKDRILESQSMAMNFPEHRFYTSAIVGGISPIAIGTAVSIKQNKQNNRVWCFLGDMSFRTAISYESIVYAISNSLPITFVIEDNDKSVDTPTQDAWGYVTVHDILSFYQNLIDKYKSNCYIIYYNYKSNYPHSGTGTFVSF